MKKVFIVSHQNGFEADPVIDELTRRNQPYFRFNQDDKDSVSASTAFIDGSLTLQFECDKKLVNCEEIGVAWFQQPPPYTGQPADDESCLQRINLEALNAPSFDLLSCPWYNHYENVMRAGNKLRQLQAAQVVGLPLLPTIISNQPDEIRSFCQKGETIAKNLATPWLIDNDDTIAGYTKLVQPNWLVNDHELRFAPVIYQKFCHRVRDYRIVATGGKYFSIYCTTSAGQEEDIRRAEHTGSGYQICEFCPELISKLSSLMELLGIDYCSADFIEDDKGNIFFLETNICGAWWWVDKYFDGAICTSITDQIIGKM